MIILLSEDRSSIVQKCDGLSSLEQASSIFGIDVDRFLDKKLVGDVYSEPLNYYKITDTNIERKTDAELYSEGLLVLSPDKIFDTSTNSTRDKTMLDKYELDDITKDEFLLFIKDSAYEVIKKKLNSISKLEEDKEAKTLLGIWLDTDETEYIDKVNKNNQLKTDFQTLMGSTLAIQDKEDLINHYKLVIIPRFEEIERS